MAIKKIIYFLMFLLTITAASAALPVSTTDLVSHWAMEDQSFTDSHGSNDAVQDSNPTVGACKVGNCADFDGTGDYVDFGDLTDLDGGNEFTIAAWIKTNSQSGNIDTGILTKTYGGHNYRLTYQTDEKARGNIDGSNDVLSTTVLSDNAWHFVVYVYDDDNAADHTMYIDGSSETTGTTDNGAISDTTDRVCIGAACHNNGINRAFYFDGEIDEVSLWKRALTATEISDLYNSGDGLAYPFDGSGGPSANFTVTVTNNYNSNPLSGVNVTIGGTTYENATGHVVTTGILQNHTTTIDLNVSGKDYFTARLTSINVSSNLETTLHQSQINFTAAVLGGTPINANFTVNGTTNTTFYLSVGTYNVTVNNTGYYGIVVPFNVSALDNKTVATSGLYQLLLRLHLRDIANNSISNTTALSVGGDTSLNVNVTTGAYNLTLLHGFYNYSSLPAGYAYTNGSTNTTGNNTPQTIDVYLYHYIFNSVAIYFYNEETFIIIDDRNVSVELISDDFSGEYSTNTGSTLISALAPVTYIVRYGAPEYSTRSYSFTLVNNTYTLLNLTLLNSSNAVNVTFNVYDSLQLPLVEATLKVLKFVTVENAYKLISSQKTNFEGQAVEAMQLNTEYYRFIVEYNGDTVLTTAPSYIFDTTVNLYANTLDSGFSSLFALTGLYGTITYDKTTRNATFTYTDEENTASQGCLYAYRLTDLNRVLLGSSCVNSPAGASIYTLPLLNDTYELRGYITKGGNNYYITQMYVQAGESEHFKTGDGLFLSAVIIITMFFIGFFAIEIGVILAGLATMILSFTGILAVSPSITIPIFVISLIVAFIISKNRTGGFL